MGISRGYPVTFFRALTGIDWCEARWLSSTDRKMTVSSCRRLTTLGNPCTPEALCILKPRLHQDTCRPETYVQDEQLVSGCRRTHVAGYKLLIRDTC